MYACWGDVLWSLDYCKHDNGEYPDSFGTPVVPWVGVYPNMPFLAVSRNLKIALFFNF